uniref:Cps7D n=1 Tax=Actinobacillus pleuropneumoniae TaxID=715 RepID=Q5QH16_ACTPL|nr:Cps7D [Actinobacillus pleuropneumoniae]
MKKKFYKAIYLFNAPIIYWRGLKYYQKKEWKKAEKYFQLAVTRKPDHAYSNFKLGMCFFKQKMWDQAYNYISIAVNLAPEMPLWKVQLRQSAAQLQVKKRRKSVKRNSENQISTPEELKKVTGISANEVAEQILIELLEKEPENPTIYAELALIQSKQAKLWQAVDSWTEAINRKSDNAMYFYQYGIVLEKLGHYARASEAYKTSLNLNPPNKILADLFFRLGFVNKHQGHDNILNIELADEAYTKAIQADKKLKSKDFGIGVFYEERRDWQQAAIAYENQIGKTIKEAELFYRIGFAYDRNYEWELAEINYQKALSITERPEWRFRLGLVLEKQKKFIQATKNYEKAAIERKQYTPYWFYRCAYTLEQQGLYERASKMYLKLRKDPSLITKASHSSVNDLILALNIKHNYDTTSAHSWFELGSSYELIQNWEKSEYAYSQAIARSNELVSLWYYRLGFVQIAQGKYLQACESLRSYRVMQRPHGVNEDILSKDISYAEVATYNEYYNILNIKEQTVLYESFSGQGMSCNPLALFLYLFNHNEYKNWTHIWVINDTSNIPEEYRKYDNVIFIRRGSDSYLRYLATTKILINNSNFPPYFIRKPEQKFLSTWHGTPFKTLGRDMEGRFFEHKNLTRNIFQSTHLLSPNAHTSKILYERHDIKEIYTGRLIESGYPRIDMTLSLAKEEKIELREKLGVLNNEKLVFYAPTWRGIHGDIEFDYEKLQSDLNKLSKLEGAKVVFRGHSLLQEALSKINLGITVVPDELDTNKILSVTDILITDYSSVLFDYLPTLKPLVLYMYDIKEYTEERGLYFSENELPGEKCYNINELVKTLTYLLENNITSVSFEDSKVAQFAPHDDGNVSEKVINALFLDDYTDLKVINDIPENKKSLLIYGGPFMGNGITTSVINLISNIDRSKYTVTLVIDPGSIEKEAGRLRQFEKLPKDINVVARVGRMNMDLEERYIHGLNNQHYELQSSVARGILQDSWEKEYQRIFGNAKFDSLIQFEGYNRFWSGVFTSIQNKKSSIYMHNSMEEEYRLKYPYLKSMFYYCSLANKVISVSELTMELNKDKLADKFGILSSKFDYSDNLQQPEKIRKLADEPLLLDDEIYFKTPGKVFLTIGRLSIEKDHAKLINSFAKLIKYYPDSKLLIIGDGSLKYALTQQIKELKLDNNVYLLGLRTNPFPLLKNADCFILPSNHEGQPMTLFEAMILGKMIIATDIVGSRECTRRKIRLFS